MSDVLVEALERTLILAPRGRDAAVAREILGDAHLGCDVCADVSDLVREIDRGADVAVVTEEAIRSGDAILLEEWVATQPPWSDFPFVILTGHGGGLERNPAAVELTRSLGVVVVAYPTRELVLVLA